MCEGWSSCSHLGQTCDGDKVGNEAWLEARQGDAYPGARRLNEAETKNADDHPAVTTAVPPAMSRPVRSERFRSRLENRWQAMAQPRSGPSGCVGEREPLHSELHPSPEVSVGALACQSPPLSSSRTASV